MPTETIEKVEKTSPVAEKARKVQAKAGSQVGLRAVLWSPQKDPTAYELPRGATEMRPYVFSYLDEEAIDITPLSPTGAVIPGFRTFTLQPGLNWVDSVELTQAIEASEKLGEPTQRVTPDISNAIERLKIASRQGYDPIRVQIRANAIKILEPMADALMTGTLSDYGVAEIAEICAVVTDAIEVESWLASVASNATNPHPQKAQVEKLLKKTLAEINSGNR